MFFVFLFRETKPGRERIEEENADKEIMEADVANAGITINQILAGTRNENASNALLVRA